MTKFKSYKKKLPKYPDGGRTPIYVFDPNDPRLKAYRDSLTAYNRDIAFDKEFIEATKKAKSRDEIIKKRDILESKYPLNNIKPAWEMPLDKAKVLYNNKDIMYKAKDSMGFKKPVQSVIYKKPKVKPVYKEPIKEEPKQEKSNSITYTDKDLYDKANKIYQDDLNKYNNFQKTIKGYTPITESQTQAAIDYVKNHPTETEGMYYHPVSGGNWKNEGIVYLGKPVKKPVNEVLSPSMGTKAYIDDFIKSDDPRFKGDSKEKRRQRAIAAFYADKNKYI